MNLTLGGFLLRASCAVAMLIVTANAFALDCPAPPVQANKDWDTQVRAEVGKVGPVTGAQLETRVRSATRDLMGKLPGADRLYLEQMMFAAYCSALRDDPALTESQKSARIKTYNLEVRKTLHAAQTQQSGNQRISAKDVAREELARIPLPYTSDTFVKSAKNGDLAAVKLFLAAGMVPNIKGHAGSFDGGGTALAYAAYAGHAKIVETLLKSKANGNEGLSAAAWNGHKEVVRLLLDHGADTQAINDAFLSAAQAGHLDVLRMLVKRGADKNLANEALNHGYSSVSVSEADGNSVARFLLELGADANVKDNEGWTALLREANKGRTSIVQTLLDAGADINVKCTCTAGGWTALTLAAQEGHGATVDILLARGANPNLANSQGDTALALALEREGSMDTVRTLLDRGANVNAKNKQGTTVLMYCIRGGSVEHLRLLLEKHADVNAKDNNGNTALMWAAIYRHGSVEKLRLLLEKHADVNAKDNNGATALMSAATDLEWAADGNVEAIGPLLDAGADLHAKDVKGRTTLMLAIERGHIEMVQALLRKGAKVNDEDAIGKTPLNYAEEDLEGKARIEMIRVLKKAGEK